MACDADSIADYLREFSGQDPLDAVVCPFVQDSGGGAGMGMGVFALFFVGFLAVGMAVRTRHPGPLIIPMMLSAGLFAVSLPGIVLKIGAIVLLVAIAGMSLFLYQRAQTSL